MKENILKTMRKNYMYGIAIILLVALIIMGILYYKQKSKYAIASENNYNLALYELVDYINDTENYLAKSTITGSSEQASETLMHIWREANLAQVYLAQLPISTNELSNTARFLNQVSDYSHSLAKKTINGENLSQEELDNLKKLHQYSQNLQNTLEQLIEDMGNGKISWKELTKDVDTTFAQQVDNLSATSFSNIDENFGEYEGLIYDGAYSEHMESSEKKGLIGEDVTEEQAKEKAISFIGQDKVQEVKSNGLIENGNIVVYDFTITIKNADSNNPLTISVSKKGGHIVVANYNREISEEKIEIEEANEIGKNFLNNLGITDMKPTYYLKQSGSVTINYAYTQDDVTIYSDLIKLKIALDNGEVLGMETTGYLNNHTERDIKTPKISKSQAKASLNKNLEIMSEGLAIIPTEWKTEIYCYEFKGKVDDIDFLVYVNSDTGKEENILVIIDTPNGILTQ